MGVVPQVERLGGALARLLGPGGRQTGEQPHQILHVAPAAEVAERQVQLVRAKQQNKKSMKGKRSKNSIFEKKKGGGW